MPELYESMHKEVERELQEAQSVSLTTDTWTTSMCSESLMSLTGHWIVSNWLHKSAVLQTSHLLGSHTAALIKDTICRMLDSWNLASKIHMVLRGKQKTLPKQWMTHRSSRWDVRHTLQPAVKEALESQRAIEDAVSVCRKIARHFSHSCLAKERLRTIQQSLPGTEQHTIIQVSSSSSLLQKCQLQYER